MKTVEWNNGLKEIHEYSDDGLVTVQTLEDVEPVLDACKALANQKLTDKGIKSGFWHYASVPTTVVYELLLKGLDIHNKDHLKRIEQEIESNYPYLKTTDKRLVIPKGSYSSRNASDSLDKVSLTTPGTSVT